MFHFIKSKVVDEHGNRISLFSVSPGEFVICDERFNHIVHVSKAWAIYFSRMAKGL